MCEEGESGKATASFPSEFSKKIGQRKSCPYGSDLDGKIPVDTP